MSYLKTICEDCANCQNCEMGHYLVLDKNPTPLYERRNYEYLTAWANNVLNGRCSRRVKTGSE